MAEDAYRIHLNPVPKREHFNIVPTGDIGWEWEVRHAIKPNLEGRALACGYEHEKELARQYAEQWAEALLMKETYIFRPGGEGVRNK